MRNRNNSFLATLSHPAFKPVALGLSMTLVVASIVLVLVQLRAGGGAVAGTSSATTNSGSAIAAYIVGAVNHPGVYHLPTTARLQDLIAAPLFDGEEVYVPRIGEPYPATTNSSGVLVNINLASATTLHTQLGITTKTADAIVAYRQQYGAFTAVDQLLLVPISRTIYDRIKDLVSV